MLRSTPNATLVSEALAAGDVERLEVLLTSGSPGDAARLLTRLDRDEQQQLLSLLSTPAAAEILNELSVQHAAQYLGILSPERAARVLAHFASNEQADLLADLGPRSEPIIAMLPPEVAQRVRFLGQYRDDTAGGLMIAEQLVFPEHLLVSDVIEDLRANAAEYSRLDVQYAYIADASNRLIGVLRMRDLLLLDGSDSIDEAMIRDPVRVRPEIHIEELAHVFDRHPLLGLPVVDDEGQVLGVVLRADVEEAISNQADRRMLVMSGVFGGEEARSMPWAGRVMRRAPWLGVSLLLSLVAASVIGWYQETLAATIALAAFLPVISGMGGNSGNQALAVSIRELSLGLVQTNEFLWVVVKEAAVGVTNGLVLGIVVAGVCFAWQQNVRLSLVVGLAIALNTLVAACLGGVVPLVLKGWRLDPALASGPVLAAVNDLCGFLFALMLADALLSADGLAVP